MAATQLLSAASDNTDATNMVDFEVGEGRSGTYLLRATGTWDTSSLTMEMKFDGTNWVSCKVPGGITDVTALTADGWIYFIAPQNVPLRAALSSVGASTEVSVWISRVNA